MHKCAATTPLPVVLLPQGGLYAESIRLITQLTGERAMFWTVPEDLIGSDKHRCPGDAKYATTLEYWRTVAEESMRMLPTSILVDARLSSRKAYRVSFCFVFVYVCFAKLPRAFFCRGDGGGGFRQRVFVTVTVQSR